MRTQHLLFAAATASIFGIVLSGCGGTGRSLPASPQIVASLSELRDGVPTPAGKAVLQWDSPGRVLTVSYVGIRQGEGEPSAPAAIRLIDSTAPPEVVAELKAQDILRSSEGNFFQAIFTQYSIQPHVLPAPQAFARLTDSLRRGRGRMIIVIDEEQEAERHARPGPASFQLIRADGSIDIHESPEALSWTERHDFLRFAFRADLPETMEIERVALRVGRRLPTSPAEVTAAWDGEEFLVIFHRSGTGISVGFNVVNPTLSDSAPEAAIIAKLIAAAEHNLLRLEITPKGQPLHAFNFQLNSGSEGGAR
jgi:hypothetical protein